MRHSDVTPTGLWNTALVAGLALLIAAPMGMAQSAKVAENSVQIAPDVDKKTLKVSFRLVDAVDVTSVSASAEGVSDPLPATWQAWEAGKGPACAWMVVVDTSNPKRAQTIEAGKEAVRSFLTGLPKTDAVAIFGLARDLEQVVPFGSSPDDTFAGVSALKSDGDASMTTLIYQNLREALGKLSEREEPRRAVLLLTDGLDETPGGPTAQEIEKNKLIEAAKAAGVAVHCLGYAEKLDDQKYFGPLKEISLNTGGLFFPASVGSRDLPRGALGLLRGVMNGAGVAHVDVSKLVEASAITITVRTASGDQAVVKIPASEVAAALPKDPAGLDPEKTPEELAKEAAAEEEVASGQGEDEASAAAAANAAADGNAVESKNRLWLMVGAGVLLALLLAALLMVRASRARAAEQARLDEATRLAEEERAAADAGRAEAARRAEETKKAEAKPLAWLEMCDAQQTRHPVRIPTLKIGRGQHNDFVLRNDSVSGNHCVLNCNREGQWSVTDLNSGNGVVLSGTRVQQAELRHGDTIELGELKMRFLMHS
jgi:hypothetical protein